MKYPIRFYLSGFHGVLLSGTVFAGGLLFAGITMSTSILDIATGFVAAAGFAWWVVRNAPYLRVHLAAERLDQFLADTPVCITLEETNEYIALVKDETQALAELRE